jgi:acetolactate synthase-1/2/3 large subunit
VFAAQWNIGVKIIILDNEFLGMVRQWQELFFERRYSSVELKNPNFCMISEGFGVKAKKITEAVELRDAVQEMLTYDGPYLASCYGWKRGQCFSHDFNGQSSG